MLQIENISNKIDLLLIIKRSLLCLNLCIINNRRASIRNDVIVLAISLRPNLMIVLMLKFNKLMTNLFLFICVRINVL